MATTTPIPFWQSLRLERLYAWNATAVRVQAEDLAALERNK